MGIYDKFVDAAKRLIPKYGQVVTIRRNDSQIASLMGVVTLKKKETGDQSTTNQYRILLAPPIAQGVIPGDYIVAKTQTYFVEAVREVSPGGIVIYYEVDAI